MRRTVYAIAAAVLLSTAVATRADAGTSVDFRISVGDRYEGATLAFHKEPDIVLVPRTKVYYVRDEDCDVYRYGRYWYFVEQGHWYRARSWRGPFLHVRTATVPRSVRGVPVKYRRNWNGPPAHAKAHGYYKDQRHDRRAERAHDHRVERRVERRAERRDARQDDRRAERNGKR
jgi:hypothetical protein